MWAAQYHCDLEPASCWLEYQTSTAYSCHQFLDRPISSDGQYKQRPIFGAQIKSDKEKWKVITTEMRPWRHYPIFFWADQVNMTCHTCPACLDFGMTEKMVKLPCVMGLILEDNCQEKGVVCHCNIMPISYDHRPTLPVQMLLCNDNP